MNSNKKTLQTKQIHKQCKVKKKYSTNLQLYTKKRNKKVSKTLLYKNPYFV